MGYVPVVTVRCGEPVGGVEGNGGDGKAGGGGKQVTWEWLEGRFQIWAGPGRQAPRVGHIYLSFPSRQAVMAQLATLLHDVFLVPGSIHSCCKIFILSNMVRTL